MYYRQEAIKQTYQNLGSDILYNRYYTDITADEYTYEQNYRGGKGDDISHDSFDRTYVDYTDLYNTRFGWDKVYPVRSKGLVQQKKSTIFPLYYKRVDTFDQIYDDYQRLKKKNYDYQNLSGSEVVWDRDSNQFNIVTHIKNSPIDLVGRLRGNSHYKEGKWNIQIPSITFMQNNEEWNGKVPPLVLTDVPGDIESDTVNEENLPEGYTINDVSTKKWTYRKEAKIRDKWIKVRVRYSGKNLAIIHSLITLYNISYS